MLDKIEISINKNYYTIKYQGFIKRTTDNQTIYKILFKDYGDLISYSKSGNDLILNFSKISIVIKSIRNINKSGNDGTLYNYLASFKNDYILKLIKKRDNYLK